MELSESKLRLISHTDLIPGLPDDVVLNCILPRLSWRSFPSLLGVSRSWNAAFISGRVAEIRRINPFLQERLLALIHKTKNKPPLEQAEDTCKGSWIMDINLAVSIYDPIVGEWEELPPIPSMPHGAPLFTRCICVDGKLFVMGGCNPENWEPVQDVYRMDLARGVRYWVKCAGMITPRANFACTCYDGKIFVAGGHGRDSLVLTTAELYDVLKEEWLPLPDLNKPSSDCLGAVLNNQIYILGGYSASTDDFPAQDDLARVSQNPFCVASMEVLEKDCKRWIRTACTGPHRQAFGVVSGQLCPLTDPAFKRINADLVTGKVSKDGMLISQVLHEEDDEGSYLALAAICVDQDVYAIKRDGGGSCYGAGYSLYRGKKALGSRHSSVMKWQPIECPFEIVELAPSCCSVSV